MNYSRFIVSYQMAAASIQTPPGNPEFVKLDDKYKCQKCHNVVRDSMQTPCGHRICQTCVDEMFSGPVGKSVQCPANEEDCMEMTRKEVSCILWIFSNI